MVTSRFSFPAPAAHPLPPAFVPVPAGVFGWLSATQLAVAQQVYQLAMERTRAALAPSRVEKLYHRSAN
jgi:hypothetical protein